jgi:hypothetical protein
MALVAAAVWPLCVLDSATETTNRQVSIAIAAIFLARGIAGYTPTWRRRFYDEPFTTFDKRYYSPLCILLGLGFVAVASGDVGA